jgi:hypothetical protein
MPKESTYSPPYIHTSLHHAAFSSSDLFNCPFLAFSLSVSLSFSFWPLSACPSAALAASLAFSNLLPVFHNMNGLVSRLRERENGRGHSDGLYMYVCVLCAAANRINGSSSALLFRPLASAAFSSCLLRMPACQRNVCMYVLYVCSVIID